MDFDMATAVASVLACAHDEAREGAPGDRAAISAGRAACATTHAGARTRRTFIPLARTGRIPRARDTRVLGWWLKCLQPRARAISDLRWSALASGGRRIGIVARCGPICLSVGSWE